MATHQTEHFLVASAKPRSRSDWQARFAFWSTRESNTEAQRIEAAKKRVARALVRSEFLMSRQWGLVPQGSWHNRTNVRGDSDVDICVCLKDSFFTDGPSGDNVTLSEVGLCPLPFTFDQFKAEIARCLQAQYGLASIKIGCKAIHLHKDDEDQVSVDAVPTYTYRLYGPKSPRGRLVLAEGVGLWANNALVVNFPDQHLENGRVFHEGTQRRFKKVVRILKRMRNHMANNPSLEAHVRASLAQIPSFLIESLVYNCRVDCFGHSEIYDDVVSVLAHLQKGLATSAADDLWATAAHQAWLEVNAIKLLFGSHQATSPSQALAFVMSARTYMAA